MLTPSCRYCSFIILPLYSLQKELMQLMVRTLVGEWNAEHAGALC